MFEGRKSIKPDITLTDMSKATILKNHKQFENVIEKNIRYAQDIIADLPYKEKMPPDEKKMLIEALLLRACALWENYIEKEIVLLIDLDPSNLLNEFDLPKNTDVNPKLIRAIIFSDHYRDFHDIDRSMSFFDRVIVDKNNAFKKITKRRKEKINFIYKLRNYLAHYSEFSKINLLRAYKQEPYNYKRFLEPGSFLIKQKGKHFEDLVDNFKMSSIHMKTIFR